MSIVSIGSIEVSIATMKKEDRCKVDEVYVCGFVPNHMLPNMCAISLDPFLQILIEEIEDLFVNGKEIHPIYVHAYSICYICRAVRWVSSRQNGD